MKRSLALLVGLLVAFSSFAEVTDLVLKGMIDKDVVVVTIDGTEVGGKLGSYNATSIALIKADGQVAEMARASIKDVRGAGVQAAQPAGPALPEVAAWKDKSLDERQAAYKERFELIADTKRATYRMGDSGTPYPLARWVPVFASYPDVIAKVNAYTSDLKASRIVMNAGFILLIPGVVLVFTGPIVLGIVFDVASIAVNLTGLIFFLPQGSDLKAAADLFNAHTRQALGLN